MNQTTKTQPPAHRFITLDEEGYFVLDGIRMSDLESGQTWLKNLRMDERHRPVFHDERSGLDVIVEAFDQPLIGHHIDLSKLEAQLPYGLTLPIATDSLCSDEWDRFYFRTKDGVPGVLTRDAQSRLFQSAESYDDESITVKGRSFQVTPKFQETTEARDSSWWTDIYNRGEMGWDRGAEHPALGALISPLKLSRSRVLVIGCGQGHDAAWWAKQGHIVTAIDFSEVALEKARALYPNGIQFLKHDAFQIPNSMNSSFDIIFEHTFFCAIAPDKRKDLIKTWYRLLAPQGRIIGFVPIMDKNFGPPYGTSEWEIRKRLFDTSIHSSARFRPLIWKRLRKESPERRTGTELFFIAERA